MRTESSQPNRDWLGEPSLPCLDTADAVQNDPYAWDGAACPQTVIAWATSAGDAPTHSAGSVNDFGTSLRR